MDKEKPKILVSLEYVIQEIISQRKDFDTFNPKLFEDVCKQVGAYHEGGYVNFDKLETFINEYLVQAEASATGRERILSNTYDISSTKNSKKELFERKDIDRIIQHASERAKGTSTQASSELSQDEIDMLISASKKEKGRSYLRGKRTPKPEKRQKVITDQMNYVSNLVYAREVLIKIYKMPVNMDLFNAFRTFCHHDKGPDGKMDYRAVNSSLDLLPKEFIEEAAQKFVEKIDEFCSKTGYAMLADTSYKIDEKYVSEVSAAFMKSYA
jgi:hypothetical protein